MSEWASEREDSILITDVVTWYRDLLVVFS